MAAYRNLSFLVSFLVAAQSLAACASKSESTSSVQETDCATDDGRCRTGYEYTPGGPSGRRLGEHANFGSLQDFGSGPAWSQTVNGTVRPGGCLVLGPYESFPQDIGYLTADIDLEGEACNGFRGGCGENFWHGYSGREYDDSHITSPNQLIVEMGMLNAAGQNLNIGRRTVAANKSIGRQTFRIETGLIGSAVSRVEVRVCDLNAGAHRRIYNCRDTPRLGEVCDQKDYVNNFRVSVYKVRLVALFDRPN